MSGSASAAGSPSPVEGQRRRRPPPGLNPATIAEDVLRLQEKQAAKEAEKLAKEAAALKAVMMQPGGLADQLRAEAAAPAAQASSPSEVARRVHEYKGMQRADDEAHGLALREALEAELKHESQLAAAARIMPGSRPAGPLQLWATTPPPTRPSTPSPSANMPPPRVPGKRNPTHATPPRSMESMPTTQDWGQLWEAAPPSQPSSASTSFPPPAAPPPSLPMGSVSSPSTREAAAAAIREFQAQLHRDSEAGICQICRSVLPVSSYGEPSCPNCVEPTQTQGTPVLIGSVPQDAAPAEDLQPLGSLASSAAAVNAVAPPTKAAPPDLHHHSKLQKIRAWRDALYDSLAARDFGQLLALAQKAVSLPVTRRILGETGAGELLGDRAMWSLVPPQTRERTLGHVAEAKRRWRELVKGDPVEEAADVVAVIQPHERWRPLGGQKAVPFLQSVDALQQFALANEKGLRAGVAAQAAWRLALLGATRWQYLRGFAADVPRTAQWPPAVASAASNMIVQSHRAMRIEDALAEAQVQEAEQTGRKRRSAQTSSAESLAEGLEDPDSPPAASRRPKLAPRAEILQAAARGPSALDDLATQAQELKKGSRRHLGSVRSALRAWHNFAVFVLHIPAAATFPPTAVSQVEAFAALFRHGGTAANYIGALRWTAEVFDYPTDSDSPGLKRLLNGGPKPHGAPG